MTIVHYQLRRLEEIHGISTVLASYFPDPASVQIGLYELLLNALEHGNLALDEATKMELVRTAGWQQEVERRMQVPEYRDRYVSVTLESDERGCSVTITDQGDGFDWRRYMEPEKERPGTLRGLGLLMVRHAGFDAVTFNEKGNEVRCTTRMEAAVKQPAA